MKVCAECGRPFEPRRETRQKYCGLGCAARVNCRNARNRSKNYWLKRKRYTCESCGAEIRGKFMGYCPFCGRDSIEKI